jgi:hypothetical protein
MAHIAIIGANIGGLPAAFEIQEILQKDTPGEHKVTVLSNHADFSFVPSNPGLPWVGANAQIPVSHSRGHCRKKAFILSTVRFHRTPVPKTGLQGNGPQPPQGLSPEK